MLNSISWQINHIMTCYTDTCVTLQTWQNERDGGAGARERQCVSKQSAQPINPQHGDTDHVERLEATARCFYTLNVYFRSRIDWLGARGQGCCAGDAAS